MRRRWRRVLYGLIVLPWLFAAAVALEVYERVQTRAQERAAETYGHERMQQAYAAAVARGMLPASPTGVSPALRENQEFLTLDDAGRAAFVKARGEAVLICGRDGIVASVYAADSPKAIAELAAEARIGTPLSSRLPANEAQDAQQAIQAVFAGGGHQTRDYSIALPSDAQHVIEFFFLPVKDAGGIVQHVAIFARDSIWEILWKKFRPNAYWNDAYEFRTNKFGFRDGDVAVPKPPGVFRIVCIGGSTTAEGLTNALTYPRLLQDKLRAHFKTDAIEAINCGIFAINSSTEIERLPDYLALEPDLIVHYNFVNDLTYGLPNWIKPVSFVIEPIKALKTLLRRSWFLYRHFNWWLLPSEAELARHINQETLVNLRAILPCARRAGADLAICSFACPDLERPTPRDVHYFNLRINNMIWGRTIDIASYCRLVGMYNARIRDLCAAEGLLYIPVAEEFHGGPESFSDICHMFPEAIDRKAGIIAKTLKDYLAPKLAARRGATPP